MFLTTLLPLLLSLPTLTSAHATMFGASPNSSAPSDGRSKYIRTPPTNDPVRDLASPNIICNVAGGTPAPSFLRAAPGDTLTFRWFHFNPSDPGDILDPSHKGAILTYIAKYTEGNGAGPIWSKLAEQGFEGGQWATIKMIANGGKVEVGLPKALAPGKYLVRQELLALHMADFRGDLVPGRGAEIYPSCVQVEVVGGEGKAVPDQGFDFNKGYKYDGEGLFFNIYVPFDKYTPPGPKVWVPK